MPRYEGNKPLSEAERMEIFLALVEAQDQQMTVAQSRKTIAKRFNVTENQIRDIEPLITRPEAWTLPAPPARSTTRCHRPGRGAWMRYGLVRAPTRAATGRNRPSGSPGR